MDMIGSLYIVATPIGNPGDITLRALDILRDSEVVICEEIRQGSSVLKKIGITDKKLIELNEHNEKDQAPEILKMLFQGDNLALISDCGTPIFSDPGAYLISLANEAGIAVVPIPGVSSLMAALSVMDVKLNQFFFAGFLPRESNDRRKELASLKAMRKSLILMDTPYRLVKLLEEIGVVFGGKQRITLACDLTLPSEKVFRGSVASIRDSILKHKAEFILIIHV
jgi:16S rRNA (cytidine1402-2'-O)-methyltransferase